MRLSLPRTLIVLSACACLAIAAAPPAKNNTPKVDVDRINKKIEGLSLTDATGKKVTLDGFKKSKAIVVVFLSFECPVSNAYSQTLVKLHKDYAAKGVAFVGINPNDDLTAAQVAKNARDYGIPFTVLKDDGFKAADLFKAKTVPEAFVLDRNHVLRYRGRIDNAYSARLKKNLNITSHDLKVALDDVLAGKSPRTPATKAIGCPIQRNDETKKTGKVTYYRDVLPILQTNCQQCHRPGEVGPFSLMTYKQAKSWANDIKDYSSDGRMPPWKVTEGVPFHNDRRLSKKEISTLTAWADGGAPEGDKKDAPKPMTFAEGWKLGKPDLILEVDSEMTVGAAGKDLFRCMVLPTGLKEDKFVVALDVKPGNNRVVHHTLNFYDTTGKARALLQKEKARKKKDDEQDKGPGYSSSMGIGFIPSPGKFGGLGGWAPGQQPLKLPEGYGFPLPKGSDVVMQIHYHRTGRVEKDKTRIGLYFAKKPGTKPYKYGVVPGIAALILGIPAGASKHKVTGSSEAQADCELHSIMPHMHLLGKSIKLTMTTPDGKTQTLLNIADWDYNWQETYFLKKPMKIKKGTIFKVEALYDNSSSNPNNPSSPPKTVFLGEQTTNEMCFVFLGGTSEATTRPQLPILPKGFGGRRPMRPATPEKK